MRKAPPERLPGDKLEFENLRVQELVSWEDPLSPQPGLGAMGGSWTPDSRPGLPTFRPDGAEREPLASGADAGLLNVTGRMRPAI